MDLIRIPVEERRGGTCFMGGGIADDKLYLTTPYQLKQFFQDDLFYGEEPITAEVLPKLDGFVNRFNNQKSMFLLEIFFICKCVKMEEKVNILYLGAAPGKHIRNLANLFPNITFHLFDSVSLETVNDTEIENIIKNERLFTDDDVADYKHLPNLYLISDIRNKSYNPTSTNPNDLLKNSQIIDEDMANQMRWAQMLNPKFAMFRYRPKLKDERKTALKILHNEEDENSDTKFLYYNYMEGLFVRMPYVKIQGNSTMLITNDYRQTGKYYHDDILEKIHYHNGVIRNTYVYRNPFRMKFSGFLPKEKIEMYVKKHKLNLGKAKSANYFVMGSGWDHHAALHIISLYAKVVEGLSNISEINEVVVEILLDTFIDLEDANIEEKAEGTEETSVEATTTINFDIDESSYVV